MKNNLSKIKSTKTMPNPIKTNTINTSKLPLDTGNHTESENIFKSMSDTKADVNRPMKIDILEYKPFDATYNNYLVLGLSGSKINNIILNTIRRVIFELIPTYAFDEADIDIPKNTSIFDCDQMRLRISNFPVIGIENPIETIERSVELEYEANISNFDKKIEDLTILEEKQQKKRLEMSQNLTMSVETLNTTSKVLNITTSSEGVKFYYKGLNINSPYESPLLIVKLKPGEEFRCTAISSINIGLKRAYYMPNAVCVFAQPLPNDQTQTYKFNLESIKQITEKEIIIRACMIINKKLDNFLKVFVNKITEYKSNNSIDNYNLDSIDTFANSTESANSDESSNVTESAIRNSSEEMLEEHKIKGIFRIENESHTFGNLLTKFLQDNDKILFAGYKIDHLLVKELTIGYKTNGTDIIEILNEAINEAKNVYKEIIKHVEKLPID